MKSKPTKFEFTIRLAGHGDTPEEAWENAANQFDLLDSQGPIPEYEILEECDINQEGI